MYTIPLTTAILSSLFSDFQCGDGIHLINNSLRRFCGHPKSVLLNTDGSFALVHMRVGGTVNLGYIIMPPTAQTRELVRNNSLREALWGGPSFQREIPHISAQGTVSADIRCFVLLTSTDMYAQSTSPDTDSTYSTTRTPPAAVCHRERPLETIEEEWEMVDMDPIEDDYHMV